jgi:hypothetical protein
MATTKTDELLAALATTLSAATNCPTVVRNRVLAAKFDAFRQVNAFATLNDGEGQIVERLMGTSGADALNEIEHNATLMLAFEAEDEALRDTVFNDALIAIDDAIKADPTLGVSDEVDVEVTALDQEPALSNPQTGMVFRIAELTITMTFQSPRAF